MVRFETNRFNFTDYVTVWPCNQSKCQWQGVAKKLCPSARRCKGVIIRMVDPTQSVVANYKIVAGIPQRSKRRPTFVENISFMIQYQFGYM